MILKNNGWFFYYKALPLIEGTLSAIGNSIGVSETQKLVVISQVSFARKCLDKTLEPILAPLSTPLSNSFTERLREELEYLQNDDSSGGRDEPEGAYIDIPIACGSHLAGDVELAWRVLVNGHMRSLTAWKTITGPDTNRVLRDHLKLSELHHALGVADGTDDVLSVRRFLEEVHSEPFLRLVFLGDDSAL